MYFAMYLGKNRAACLTNKFDKCPKEANATRGCQSLLSIYKEVTVITKLPTRPTFSNGMVQCLQLISISQLK